MASPSRWRLMPRLGICLAALWCHAGAEAQQVIENAFLRVELDAANNAAATVSVKRPKAKRLTLRLGEDVVFQEGTILPVEGFKPDEGAAGSMPFVASLPANPLLGKRVAQPLELPYYRPDRTSQLTLRRDYRLGAGGPFLELRYSVVNQGAAATTFCLRLTQGFLAGDKPLTAQGPDRDGRVGPPTAYEYDLPGAWMSFNDKYVAVVAECDPAVVSCLYRQNPRLPAGAVTTEITLAPGAKWETSVRLHFLPSFPAPDGVEAVGSGVSVAAAIALPRPPTVGIGGSGSGGEADPLDALGEDAGDLDLEGKQPAGEVDELVPFIETGGRRAFAKGEAIAFKLYLHATGALRAKVQAAAEHLVTGKRIAIGEQQLELTPGEVTVVPLSFTPPSAGTWVVRARVAGPKGEAASFQRPMVVGKPAGAYVHESVGAPKNRQGREFNRFRPELFRKPNAYDYLHQGFAITEGMPSLHIPYAKPLTGGPLRVLMAIPFRRAREVVELTQRLDCQVDTVLIGCHMYPGPQAEDMSKMRAPVEEIRAMRRALAKRPEVIFLAAYLWNWFPFDIQREMIRQVAEDGAGLITAAPLGLPRQFEEKLRLAERTNQGRTSTPVYESCGRGWLAYLSAQASTPQYFGVFAVSEEMLETVSRALIRLGRGTAPVAIKWRAAPAYQREVELKLANRGDKPFKGRLEMRVWLDFKKTYRDVGYQDREEAGSVGADIELAAGGAKAVSLTLPHVPAGQYRVFAVVKDQSGAVVWWTSQAQTKAPEMAIGKPKAVHGGVRLAPRLYRADTAHISFEAELPESGSAGLTAFVQGLDRSGREVLRAQQPLGAASGATEIKFELPLARVLHRHFVLRVGVQQGDRVLGENRAGILVDRAARFNKFRFVLLDNENWFPHEHVLIDDFAQYGHPWTAKYDGTGWGYGGFHGVPNALSKQQLEILEKKKIADAAAAEAKKHLAAKDGLATGDAGLNEEMGELLADIADEEAQAIEAAKPKEHVVFTRPDCYNNPEQRAFHLERLLKRIGSSSDGWPQRTFVDDEYLYGSLNTCQCEHCQAAFQRYLEKGYGTLERLNQEWGAAFKSFAEAELMHFEDLNSPPTPKDLPRAADTLMYKAQQYHDRAVDLRSEVQRQIDPEYTIGASGVFKMETGSFLTAGNDHWAMASMGGVQSIYRDYEEWSSFAGPPHVFCWGSGYGRNYNPSHQAWHPWFRLFDGQYGVGHFTSNGYPMASPDGTLHIGPKKFFANWDLVRHGPGELLLGYEVRDPVAIHWSGPSFYVVGVERWIKHGKPSGTVLRWMNHSLPRAVGGQRLRPYYISHAQLEKGVATFWGAPKLIFMNYSSAVSMKEAEVLRRFVQDGGMLVGGVDTATRSEHGFPYATPPLDEVFGIRHEGGFAPVLTKGDEGLTTVTLTLPGEAEAMTSDPQFVNPNVVAAGAKSHGRWGNEERGGPVFFVNRFGKGTAIYLNFPLVNLYAQRAQIGDWLYRQAGIEPFASITGKARLGRFRDGANYYFGLLPSWGLPPDMYAEISAGCTVGLREKRHVYDSRAARYMGLIDTIRPDFREHVAKLYACLPYRVEALRLDPAPAAKPGAVVRFGAELTASAEPGRHVLRVDVVRPDGQPQNILGYNQTAPAGKATIEIPLAYNAPTGRWSVTVRDVATGIEAKRELLVEP